MSNPLPPLFPVENNNKDTEEYVSRIVRPIFDKVANETPKKRISVGLAPKKDILTFYNPHNCRVYFKFSWGTFRPPNTSVNIGCNYFLVNSREHLFKEYLGSFNICIKKNFIEVRPLNNRFYVIERDNPILIEAEKKKIDDNIINFCVEALKSFVKEFGVVSDCVVDHFKILEKKHTGDSITEKLDPKDMFRIMHDGKEIGKKVYNETNIEIADGISHIDGNKYDANYIRNILLKDLTPEIAASISDLSNSIKESKTDVNTSVVTMGEVLSSIKLLAQQNIETAQGLNGLVSLIKAQQPKINEDIIPKEGPDYFG